MFGLIPTKDLYIVQLACVTDRKIIGWELINNYSNERYALAAKISGSSFIDVFTSTKYKANYNPDIGDEIVRSYSSIITNKKVLTKKEATLLLKELNDIYICEKDNIISFQRILDKKRNRGN